MATLCAVPARPPVPVPPATEPVVKERVTVAVSSAPTRPPVLSVPVTAAVLEEPTMLAPARVAVEVPSNPPAMPPVVFWPATRPETVTPEIVVSEARPTRAPVLSPPVMVALARLTLPMTAPPSVAPNRPVVPRAGVLMVRFERVCPRPLKRPVNSAPPPSPTGVKAAPVASTLRASA